MANKKSDREFFEIGFDDVTITKLDLYERYLQEWLPVPLSGRMGVREAAIYDLFCGPGKDSKGQAGSPLRAKNVVFANRETILRSHVPLRMVFNDYDEQHVSSLSALLGNDLHTKSGESLATVEYYSSAFDDIFPHLLEQMTSDAANMLFIDQFGATAIDEDRFRDLHSLKRTDVLFFISSNWFWRFVGRPEATEWNVTKEDLSQIQYKHVHRFMANHFRQLVGDEYFVAPFSLKKGSNIYGMIFASHDTLGLEKFLKVAWEKDPHTGEADYDIDDDGLDDPNQVLLFEPKKVASFRDDLRERIRNKEFKTDCDIYIHMLQSGFLNKHTKDVVMEFASKSAGFMEFQNEKGRRMQCRLSRDTIREPRAIVYSDL